MYADLLRMCNTKSSQTRGPSNLTHLEQTVLDQLTNTNIIIKSADKEGGVVIQNRINYIAEAQRLLSDHHTYHKLSRDPLPVFSQEAISLADSALQDNIITKAEAAFFKKHFFKTPYFYHLSKWLFHLYGPVPSANCPTATIVHLGWDPSISGFHLMYHLFTLPFLIRWAFKLQNIF